MADNDRITPQNGASAAVLPEGAIFRKASEFDNVALPEEFRDILNRR